LAERSARCGSFGVIALSGGLNAEPPTIHHHPNHLNHLNHECPWSFGPFVNALFAFIAIISTAAFRPVNMAIYIYIIFITPPHSHHTHELNPFKKDT